MMMFSGKKKYFAIFDVFGKKSYKISPLGLPRLSVRMYVPLSGFPHVTTAETPNGFS
jgi:hypothetical protein